MAPDTLSPSATKPARFPITGCSQCGQTFGPGNSGFSHCKHHKGKRPLTAREETAALAKAKKEAS